MLISIYRRLTLGCIVHKTLIMLLWHLCSQRGFFFFYSVIFKEMPISVGQIQASLHHHFLKQISEKKNPDKHMQKTIKQIIDLSKHTFQTLYLSLHKLLGIIITIKNFQLAELLMPSTLFTNYGFETKGFFLSFNTTEMLEKHLHASHCS